MFSRLKQHAIALENDIQTLQKTLESKLKRLFSVAETEPSEASVKFFEELILELKEIENNTLQMIHENYKSDTSVVVEYKKYCRYMKELMTQLSVMEDYLEGFGYVKYPNKFTFLEDNGDFKEDNIELAGSIENLTIDEVNGK